MIAGVVTPGREAIIRLRLRGPTGIEADVEAVVDTGFTEFLSLPRAQVNVLGLPFLGADDVSLADGTIVAVDLHEGDVTWDGKQRTVIIHCLEGAPLIGMSLLYDHLLTVEVVDGGAVTLTALP